MNNRIKILKTALRLFSDFGYESVGIQQIVDEADITKPTLYHYFGSKRGLLDAILEEYFNDLIEAVKIAAKYTEINSNMINITKTFFNFVKKNKTFYRMQLAMFFSSPHCESHQAIEKYNKILYDVLEELFIKAANDHGNMKGRQVRYAFTFLGMINNYISLFISGYINLDDEAIQFAVHQFSHGIYS